MTTLQSYGWNEHFMRHFQINPFPNLEAARVLSIQGFIHLLITETGHMDAQLAGTLINSRESETCPKVGDWVLVKRYEEEGMIIDTLPRLNELSRKAPGSQSARQVLAANIDGVFIVQGLDRDFNLMRLQRYLHQIVQCNIQPVVLLNKKDLVPDPETYRQQVLDLGYSCPVVLTSALYPMLQSEWTSQYLQPQQTYILLGSSGAGKSTLLNNLLGYQLQKEGTTSAANNKGKHTTTARHLVLLPNGSMIIDAPGMREFGITVEAGKESANHPLIEELAPQCRFGDCTHQHEPGCAVIAAFNNGSLPELVYRSYLKLLREQYHFQASESDKRRDERRFTKMAKQIFKHRKNRKY
ncbi:ribosome small subunit-dependent GTPase A [Chitinophaga sp. GCM10012297]|uniref:Small ribosomal subunit biogenesis GTPase RsgA n=1 Tax=Chitinophaga chungangae TaxID=2821488 RepID=A0ABS3YJ28_9BACT|nr:ribosome small subunit-dependent GTPase A [Chitinophaga chungangae]MBO9154680.1 ribosome small subunit-dependent GTPase A [Chitinophaga chungangae]